jgi:tetratricopeptide (TPR) repeat protein
MRKVSLAMLVAFSMFIISESAVAKKNTPPDKAKIEFRKGNKLYKAKKYKKALHAYRKAYEIKPRWKYLYHIGRSEAALGKPIPAELAFEAYLAKGKKKVPKKRQKATRQRLKKLRLKIGELAVQAPDGAIVFLDGTEVGTAPIKKPLRVKANQDHVVTVKLDGKTLPKQTVSVAGMKTAKLQFEKPVEEPSPVAKTEAKASGREKKKLPPLEIAGWATLAGGAALLIAGTVTGAMALSLNKDLEDDCQNGCPGRADDVDKRDNLAMSTNFLLAFGAAAAVAGSVIIIIVYADKAKKATGNKVSLRPMVGPQTAGAVLEWRF